MPLAKSIFSLAEQKRTKNRSRGAALVEFIVTFPLLLILLAGLIELGSLITQSHAASDAVRDGIRVATIITSGNADPSCFQISETAIEAAQDYLFRRNPPPSNRWAINRDLSGVTTSTDPLISPTIQTLRLVAVPNGNCIFCITGFLDNIQIPISMTGRLPNGCAP